MPKLAAFPKAYMTALCKDGSMTVSQWITLAATLDVQGLEWYAGFLEMGDEQNWPRFRQEVESHGMVIPMMCCSPDKEEDGAQGYAKRLRHGEIGQGLNDYDAIFTELKSKGFDGWISIEDGVDGIGQLRRSVTFLKTKIAQHWA
jgi:hypothetical protein